MSLLSTDAWAITGLACIRIMIVVGSRREIDILGGNEVRLMDRLLECELTTGETRGNVLRRRATEDRVGERTGLN